EEKVLRTFLILHGGGLYPAILGVGIQPPQGAGYSTPLRIKRGRIIAFFGAPLELPDRSRRACVPAVMMKRLEAELNRKFIEDGLSPGPAPHIRYLEAG
ncbi:MAG: hypothetical protein LBO76_06895, partial [Treponema sp.]|nr:hypothetical protein [Treponema sp.]